VAADNPSTSALDHAAASAALATRLDPLSDSGLKAQAAIAFRRGDASAAQSYLLRAVRRQPTDSDAWISLAGIDARLGDASGVQRAFTRALMLDPQAATTLRASGQANGLLSAPPKDSATAIPVP
jgi:Flp pilus assembly protein TadD